MKTDIAKLINEISKFKGVLLLSHVFPDGDAIGSLFALGLGLKLTGKDVEVYLGEDRTVPTIYRFLVDERMLLKGEPESKMAITVDCANLNRVRGEELLEKMDFVVNVDHHPDNSRFADLNIVSSDSSSVAEMVYDMLKAMKVPIDKDIARAIYVGIVTDTGRFQYGNTTARSHLIAAELIDNGINPNEIFKNVFEQVSWQYLQLAALALDRIEISCDKKYVYSFLMEQDFRKFGAGYEDAEEIINQLRALRGVKIACLAKQVDEVFKVSLRSDGEIDVGRIARQFNGGGHQAASGFTFEGDLNELNSKLHSLIHHAICKVEG